MSNKPKIDLVIIGTGAFSREVLWTIQDYNEIHNEFSVLGFLDDNESLLGQTIDGIKVLGNTDWIFSKKNKIKCVIGIADSQTRKKIVHKFEKEKISFQTIIHPSVIFSKSSKIGNGTIIQAGGIITTDTVIGNHGAVLPYVQGAASLVWGRMLNNGRWGVSLMELKEHLEEIGE